MDNKVTTYIIQAQEEEIKRIANELHEGVAQTLFSLFTGLQLIEKQLIDPSVKQMSSEMVQLTERTIEEIRWISTELYPASLDTLGIIPALRAYLKIFSSTFGIVVEVFTKGTERDLSPVKRLALYRASQEALINSAKYADTGKILIEANWGENELVVTIEDFGVGFKIEEKLKQQECLGIAAMKHRLELFSGDAKIESMPGTGTKVILSIPVS